MWGAEIVYLRPVAWESRSADLTSPPTKMTRIRQCYPNSSQPRCYLTINCTTSLTMFSKTKVTNSKRQLSIWWVCIQHTSALLTCFIILGSLSKDMLLQDEILFVSKLVCNVLSTQPQCDFQALLPREKQVDSRSGRGH